MNVVVGSAFRNSADYLLRYLNQVTQLKYVLGDANRVRVIAAEGDSSDDTYRALTAAQARSLELEIVECSHGQPWFGSTEESIRMVSLSKVGNAIFDAVRATDDVLVYVESDLLWDAHTITQLITMAWTRERNFDVFSPMVFAGPHFYDTWGYRKNGERFGPFAPYHSCLNGFVPTEIDSAGSCLVMRGEVARACRIRNDYCLVGWCEDARAKGYRLAVHPGYQIRHPA